MSNYYREQGYHSRKRLARRLRYLFLFLLLCMVAGGVAIGIDAYRQSKEAEQPSQLTAPVNSTVVASTKVHNSQYFQFQSPKSWVAIANETTGDKFVYHSSRSGIIESILTIYVNQEPPTLQVTRVLPVSVGIDQILSPDDISDHCTKSIPGGERMDSKQITLLGVSILCDSNSSGYTVVAGLKNGTPIMKLSRPNGQTATYLIHYSNIKAIPDGNEFKSIVSTFQVR